MVAKLLARGLIATAGAATAPALQEAARWLAWPVLGDATPRRLQHALTLHDPQCLLFWLSERQGLETTSRLIAWTRTRGPRPLRLAAACELDSGVEAALRAAGAHGLVELAGRSAAQVAAALEPLLRDATVEAARAGTPALRRPAPTAATEPAHPP